jgi:hypothetical protein
VGAGSENLAGKFDPQLDFERTDFFLEFLDKDFHVVLGRVVLSRAFWGFDQSTAR